MLTSSAPSSPLAPSYSRADWQGGYVSQPQEMEYPITDIEGQVPPDLKGTLFRNGPGLLDIHGQRIHHPFDGDGMVCQFTLQNGAVHFRNRYVRTEEYVAEQAAGKILYRGVFGTQKPGGWLANIFDLKMKKIANTNVLYWNDRLWALWEGSEPYRLDPHTLETLGIDRLDGLLAENQPFTAHPRIDPGSPSTNGEPRLVAFSVKTGPSSSITIYEFDPRGQVVQQQTRTIPGFAFLHDFALTEHYCIFFQNPVTLNPLPFLFGLQGPGQCLRFQKQQPTKAIVIPRDPAQAMQVLETEACFVFHHANAFEVPNPDHPSGLPNLLVDSICYDSLPVVNPKADYLDIDFDQLDPGLLWRSTLNLQAQTVERRCWSDRCVEFPSLQPALVGKRARYYYMGAAHHPQGNAPLQAIVKLDLETGQETVRSFAPRSFANEPIFVPHPQGQAEDEGWVLGFNYNAEHHCSDLVILNAQTLETEAILHLKQHIPYGLHGTFVATLA
ncbi:MAG: carotenoid oxygenase family protein [Prochlorotrichaceae cyanobacterium]